MDCVTTTRHARMGILYAFKANDTKRKHEIDVLKLVYKKDFLPIEERCSCYTCQNFSRSYLHHLFKQRELLAYHLATIHNIAFMEDLFAKIRESIENDTFKELKKNWG